MANKNKPSQAQTGANSREVRLKAALKANLMRRKAQSRGRARLAEADETGKDILPDNPGQDKDA